jgi:hypothetical protein
VGERELSAEQSRATEDPERTGVHAVTTNRETDREIERERERERERELSGTREDATTAQSTILPPGGQLAGSGLGINNGDRESL